MDALLILTATVLIVVAWIWLVASSLRLPIHRTVVAAILPVATLFLRDRGYPRAPRLLLILGLMCAIAGIALLYHQQPERFDALISGEWLEEGPAQTTLDGAIMGQPFRPDRAYWRGNELLFEEGPASRIRRSIGIRFDTAPQLLSNAALERIPGDEANWPELVLQWHSGALEPPGLRKVTADYSLSISFAAEDGERARVQIHMHLLPVHGTWLRGDMSLADTPPWLADILSGRAKPTSTAAAASAPAKAAPPASVEPVRVPRWDEVSLLALLDEPGSYVGGRLRLTTVSGRSHEGVFKGVTEDQRIILAQPRGANQVDFQFAPADIERVESSSLR